MPLNDKNTDALFEYKTDKKKELRYSLIAFIPLFLFGIIQSSFIFSISISVSFVVAYHLIQIVDRTKFNSYKVFENYLTLSNSTVIFSRRVKLDYSAIKSIKYSRSTGRGGSWIVIDTKKEKYMSPVPGGIFSFAKALKYLKDEKGINVILSGEGDHEIELYLNNEIDEIPMKNNVC